MQPQGFTMVDTAEGTLITIDPSLSQQQQQQHLGGDQFAYMTPGQRATAFPPGFLTGPEVDAVKLRPRFGPGNGNAAAAAGSSIVLLLAGVLAALVALGL